VKIGSWAEVGDMGGGRSPKEYGASRMRLSREGEGISSFLEKPSPRSDAQPFASRGGESRASAGRRPQGGEEDFLARAGTKKRSLFLQGPPAPDAMAKREGKSGGVRKSIVQGEDAGFDGTGCRRAGREKLACIPGKGRKQGSRLGLGGAILLR